MKTSHANLIALIYILQVKWHRIDCWERVEMLCNVDFCFRFFCSPTANCVFWRVFSPFPDARFFDLSSTLYSDKRQTAARFWHFWYNTTRLYTNRPGQKPYDGNIFGNTGRGKGGGKQGGKTLKPPRPTPRTAEVTPTIGVNFRTDSQFSVEQSVATQVYDKASYGRSKNKDSVDKDTFFFNFRRQCAKFPLLLEYTI